MTAVQQNDTEVILDKNQAIQNTPFEFSTDFAEHTKWTKPFKVHVTIGGVITTICFLIWFFIALFGPGFCWPIMVLSFFTITTAFHFYILIRPKEWLQYHIIFFSVVNLMIFYIWAGSRDFRSAWFLSVFFGMAIPLSLHAALSLNKGKSDRGLLAHIAVSSTISLFCFVLWLDTGKGYPWFLIVAFSLAFPLVIHWCVQYYQGATRTFRLHVGFFSVVQFLLFLIWATTSYFPWFVFVLAPGIGLLGIHYFRYRNIKNKSEMLPTNSTNATNASNPTQPTEQPNPMELPPPGYYQAQTVNGANVPFYAPQSYYGQPIFVPYPYQQQQQQPQQTVDLANNQPTLYPSPIPPPSTQP